MAEYIITDEQLDKLANKHERIIVLRSEYGDAFPVSMEGEILRGLVRCRDCMWYIFDGVNEYCAGLDYTTEGANAYVEPDDFCSWGEKSDPGASPMAGGRSRFSDSAVRIGTEPRHDMDYSIFVTGTSTDAEPVRYIPERTCHMERDDVYPCADDGCKRLSVPEWTCSECECENIGMKPHYCQNCGAKVIEE